MALLHDAAVPSPARRPALARHHPQPRVLDPNHKKMSKSKGNIVTLMPLVEEFGSDAVRYWACNGCPERIRRWTPGS